MAENSLLARGTTNQVPGSLIVVRLKKSYTVTYVFELTDHRILKMPFAVLIDGVALSSYATKPAECKSNTITVVNVAPGSKVALYLNSDAHPAYRNNPVYAVQLGSSDIKVRIVEKSGRHAVSDTPLKSAAKAGDAGSAEHYTAPLTGDIWMKITHRYTVEQAAALLPADTDSAIREAVLSIYRVLWLPYVTVTIVGDTGRTETFKIEFGDSDNAVANITKYSLMKDALPRVHPCAYLALLLAMRDAGIRRAVVNSGWRPMLGSIAHRAGLGLDVNYFESKEKTVRVNRQDLRSANATQYGNVSARERELFAEYERAKVNVQLARKRYVDLKRADEKDPGNVAIAREVEEIRKHVERTSESMKRASKDWSDERDRHEPASMRSLRSHLTRSEHVRQLFDPWYMDSDSKDLQTALPNEQRKDNDNETLHAHHLHITVAEPKIL